MKEVRKRGLLYNIMYSGIGSIVYTFCQWLLTIIIIRLCGYTDSGYYALAITVTNTFYSISLWGIRSFQIADIDNKYDYSDYFYNRILTNIIAFICFIIFMLINNYSFEKSLIIILYMIYKVADSFFDFYDALCQKNMRMDIVSISMMMRSILSTIIFALLCFIFKSIFWAIISMIVISIVFLYFYNYRFCKKNFEIHYHLNKDNVMKMLMICTPLMLSGFLLAFNLMIPKYIFEKMFDSKLLGIYTTITSLALIVQLAAQTILAPMLPTLAEYFDKKDYKNFKGIIIKFVLLCCFVLVMAFIGLKLIGPWVIGVIYGVELSKYTYLLYLAILSSFFTIILWIVSYLLILIKKTKVQLFTSAISALICLGVSYICIEIMSLNGISMAIIISQISLLIMMIIILKKHMQLK